MKRLHIAYLACCLAFFGGLLACAQDVSKPNYEFSPDMAYSRAYESFSANPNFPDGKTLAAPPVGTLPRDPLQRPLSQSLSETPEKPELLTNVQVYRPFHYATGPEEALRAGREWTDPLSKNPQAHKRIVERGRVLYERMCLHCHGADLHGGGLVTRLFVRPPSLLANNARDMKDGQIFHIITLGQGNMPGHGPQISQEDRWKIIRYLRTYQASVARAVAPKPANENGNADTPSQGAL